MKTQILKERSPRAFFLGEVGGNTIPLANVLNGNNKIPNDALTLVSPGVFSFEVFSRAPSIKLIDSTNPVDGAGVYEQTLSFTTETTAINNDGTLGSGDDTQTGPAVDGPFAFYPIMNAVPDDLPAAVTWGEKLPLTTQVAFNTITGPQKYLLLTPFIITRQENNKKTLAKGWKAGRMGACYLKNT